jgi:hypothetical protein
MGMIGPVEGAAAPIQHPLRREILRGTAALRWIIATRPNGTGLRGLSHLCGSAIAGGTLRRSPPEEHPPRRPEQRSGARYTSRTPAIGSDHRARTLRHHVSHPCNGVSAVMFPVAANQAQFEQPAREESSPRGSVATMIVRVERGFARATIKDGAFPCQVRARSAQECPAVFARRQLLSSGEPLPTTGPTRAFPGVGLALSGADFVIGSDVWEISSILRGAGFDTTHPKAHRMYPAHYRNSLQHTNLLIHPRVPWAGYWPGDSGMERMIAAGEQAARHALQSATERPRPLFATPRPSAHGSSGCPD